MADAGIGRANPIQRNAHASEENLGFFELLPKREHTDINKKQNGAFL